MDSFGNTKIKDISQYLHLYLGCELKSEKYPKDTPLDTEILHAIEHDNLYGEFKPILRPLSSMTEEENKERFNEWYLKEENTPLERNAREIKYLLSKHFDLFGLIDAGLAIDKTKLK